MALRVVLSRIMEGRGDLREWKIPTRMAPPGQAFPLELFRMHLPTDFTRTHLKWKLFSQRCAVSHRQFRGEHEGIFSTELVLVKCEGTLVPIRFYPTHLARPQHWCRAYAEYNEFTFQARTCEIAYSCTTCAASCCQSQFDELVRERFSRYVWSELSPLVTRILKCSIPYDDFERGHVNSMLIGHFQHHRELFPSSDPRFEIYKQFRKSLIRDLVATQAFHEWLHVNPIP